MKIGLFTDTYTPQINGVSTSVEMLKRALEKKQNEVYIITVSPDSMKYEIEEDNHIIRIPGIPIGIYDYRLTGIYPVKAVNIIKKLNLDIIHSHTEFGIGTFARLMAFQLDIPLVHTYHTMYEDYIHYITKGFFDKSSKKIVEYLTLFYCDRTASELIVPTKKTYDLFKEKYKVDKNIHIVPTGIEIDRFYLENIDMNKLKKLQDKYKITAKDFTAIFVGRLAKEKNIMFLIEIIEELKEKIEPLKLLIVGDGPDYEEYAKYIKKHHLEKYIILTGKVPWEEIPYYYHLGKIFLTASTTETQGLTVIEAMASGIPPICIDDESFRNTVVEDLNGYIFKDKPKCKDILYRLYSDPKKLKKISNQARINSETYSSKYYAESILDVYQYAITNYESRLGVIGKIVNKLKGEKDEAGDK
ncbi:MAG: glycosyltransferase [bacterium]|nr:glycosyltransferase [bacterium]